jgi:hypothetical protein
MSSNNRYAANASQSVASPPPFSATVARAVGEYCRSGALNSDLHVALCREGGCCQTRRAREAFLSRSLNRVIVARENESQARKNAKMDEIDVFAVGQRNPKKHEGGVIQRGPPNAPAQKPATLQCRQLRAGGARTGDSTGKLITHADSSLLRTAARS